MYIIYVYNPFWVLITQIFDISELNIKLKINDIWTASFVISSNFVSSEILQEYNKVKIFKIQNNEEKELFSWVITANKSNLEKTEIILNSELFLFKKRILFVNKTYTNQNISYIINDLATHINSRESNFIKYIDCDIADVLPSKTFNIKKDLLSIIKDIAWNTYEFDFYNWVLSFKKSIWVDRSIWDNIILFELDINNQESRSISSFSIEKDWNNTANAIICDDWNIEDTESIQKYWRVEASYSWLKTDVINERKNGIKTVSAELIVNDFFLCNLWDLVFVYINWWKSHLLYSWALKIIEKSYKSWTLENISFLLWNGTIKSLNIIETIQDLKQRINSLELT